MSEPETSDLGLIASVRRFSDSLLALVYNRVLLFSVEFQTERLRLLDRLFCLAIGLSLAFMGLIIGVVAAALYLWRHGGLWAIIALAAVLFIAGCVVLFRLRAQVLKTPAPFADTLAEFEKDRSCLQDQD